MRRIVLAAMSTLTVLVLLLGYHTSLSGRMSEQTFATSGSTAGSASASGSASAGSTDTSSGTSSGTSTTKVTGSVAQTRWGPVQVQLTVTDGRITAVDLLQQPDDNPRDQEINATAVPQLVEETVSAQSADIDMVSGATVTSTGYLESLQAALDEAQL